MQTFLNKVVKHICLRYPSDISDLCIVLPNRRAGLFIKNNFASELKKTFFSPSIYSTEDFISLLSEMQIADSTTLLFELYESFKSIAGLETETFDEFSKWGQILLNDFNEIDRYLIDANQLFGNLKNIKDLETWTLNGDDLTEFQNKYLQFWNSLGNIYNNFHTRLLAKQMVTQGLAYKIVAAEVEQKTKKHNWKKIIFAGFNALNKAEEEIIEKLINLGNAEIIWDADNYYFENKQQEAGKFFRKYEDSGQFKKQTDTNFWFKENLLSTENKKINLIGVAKNVAQAKVAGTIINDIKKTNPDLKNTALVLADENLLFPVLHSLPADLKDINVTMGYPLKNTPVAGYFELLFNLHDNALKLSKSKTNYSFYHIDVIKFLSHPYSTVLLSSEIKINFSKQIVNIIQQRNIVFLSKNILSSLTKELECVSEFEVLKSVFTAWKTPIDSFTCIHHIIQSLKNKLTDKNENKTNLELEYLFSYLKIINRVSDLMHEYNSSVTDLKTLRAIVKQLVSAANLPFYGEPLMGLQMMGMLESRTLDFENVILLSCNEDILPSAKTVNSFVPYELKRHFGLPTHSERDAIFAYHFYRLIQRAKNIYLIYNTESSDFGSGEKSRFLSQLIYELPKINNKAIIEEKLVTIPVSIGITNNFIEIKKTTHIINLLNAKAEYGFSPSALNKYRKCGLQFYLQSVAGLKETEEVEENIGADVLGNTIHKALEIFYKPFVGKKLKASDISEMTKSVESTTIRLFEEDFSKTEIGFGKNLLTVKVAVKFISDFLKKEKYDIEYFETIHQPVFIKALEQDFETTIEINNKSIKIKGKADRVDSIGKTTRIVDYKTGQATAKELAFEDWNEIITNPELEKSFQLLMYALMYQRMNPTITENITSGIITFRELSAGLKTVRVNKNEELSVDVLKKFEEQLKILLTEIFNPDVNFAQTDDLDTCEYCSFKGICNR